jgi:hypothetical protein
MKEVKKVKEDFYNNSFIRNLLEKEDIKDKDFIDWFIFQKIFNDKSNLREFITSIEDKELKSIFNSWVNSSIFSIFKLKKINNDNYLMLNVINNNKYNVLKSSLDREIMLGEYYIARILPYYDNNYIFSNLVYKLKLDKKEDIYTIIAKFEVSYPQSVFIDNTNKINLSFQIQELEYKDFIDFFGSDEIIVEGKDIEDKLIEFYHYRYFQKKEKTSGKTIAKLFREKYGTFPTLPNIDIPEQILNLPEVGILYDKKEGLNFLPWYGLFKYIFNNPNFREIPGYKDCIIAYLNSDTISSLPFRRVLKNNQENFVEVIKDVLSLESFHLPDDFEDLMDNYGKNKLSSNLEPTVIPVSDKTKALLRTKKPEEYGILNLSPKLNSYTKLSNDYKLEEII